jgi:hypothetical protein
VAFIVDGQPEGPMIRPALLLYFVVVVSSGCTLFSRSVPCDDAGDCPAPLDACVDARCVESTGPICGNGIRGR